MIYKLFNEPTHSPIEQILINRGVPKNNIEEWLNAGWPQINSPWLFGRDAMENACRLFDINLMHDNEIYVLVDPDVDGFTSAAIIINFITDIKGEEWSKEHVHYIFHTGKQHGLKDCVGQFPDECFVILPDSSTNDIEEIQSLNDRFCAVLILDHHEADQYLDNTNLRVTINNQICGYPNKDISAAGVVWQFFRAYQEWSLGNNWSTYDKYIDLAALGCLSDMMNYRSIETKAIITLGLQNIKNPFFYYMTEKNEFSINRMGGINYMSIAFYVTPFINAIVRSGTAEEKDLIFKSFLTMYAFEKIESGKRGHKGELVPRVEEAIRIATNVKARQTKLQDSAMELLEKRIESNGLSSDAIIVLTCEPGEVEKNIAGLVANKIQAKYQHPCLVLTKSQTIDDKEPFYRGSARNYSMSDVQDLRAICLETDLVEYATGHANAFGISIAESNIDSFIEKTNQLYEQVEKEPVYWVDYIWTKNEVNPEAILNIAEHREMWGQEIPEPYICLKDIPLSSCQIQALAWEKSPTIKIHLDCNVDVMKFKSNDEELEQMSAPNAMMTAICRCNKNEWNGRITPQLIVEAIEIREEWVF